MKKLIILIILFNSGAFFKAQTITFTENKGQISDQFYKSRFDVLFFGSFDGVAFHLRNKGISYQLSNVNTWKEVEDLKTKEMRKVADQVTTYRLDIDWLDINENYTIQTQNELNGFNNYYLASCPQGITGVKTYESVFYNQIYNNINLHYYQKDNTLKYDYIVAPGADYKQIKLKIKGATSISVNEDGSILLTTPLGDIREEAPIVYQSNKLLKAKWILKNDVLSFDIEKYNTNQELIIDPIIRLWGTYCGGSAVNAAYSSSSDSSGNVFICGETWNEIGTAIATSGSHQSTFGGFYNDAFLVKFNTNGIRQRGTFYGGTCYDMGYSCSSDSHGNVYMAGSTCSLDSAVIATVGSHLFSLPWASWGTWSGFLVKFDSLGVRQWGTYYGNEALSCETDKFDNVYVTGSHGCVTTVNSATEIPTPGCHQSLCGGGVRDAYLVKFDALGTRLWGTFYGGSGNERGFCCNTDFDGNVYLSGFTDSNNGTAIATANSHQSTNGGGVSDAFIVKFDSSGVRQWGTYYGGMGEDISNSCSIDLIGNVFVTGQTNSSLGNSISTSGSHQVNYGGGVSDAFLVKFNSLGVRQWGSFYGDTGVDEAFFCANDSLNNVYITGHTAVNSGAVIASSNAYQLNHGGGFDAFLIKFSSNGMREWGTYYGGAGYDEGRYCVIDNLQNLYFGGNTGTNTNTIIATLNSYQPLYGDNGDAFLVKFSCISLIAAASNNGPVCLGNSVLMFGSTLNTPANSYNWSGPNNFTSSVLSPSISNVSLLNNGVYTLTVYDNSGCYESSTTNLIVNPLPNINVVSSASVLCIGNMAILTANGAATYTWNTGSTGATEIISPNVVTNYTVNGVDLNGCSNLSTISQSVSLCLGVQFVNSNPQSLIQIFPNPNNGLFDLVSTDSIYEIQIINSLGQIVYQSFDLNSESTINIRQLDNGIYVIKVFQSNKTSNSFKIIKQ